MSGFRNVLASDSICTHLKFIHKFTVKLVYGFMHENKAAGLFPHKLCIESDTILRLYKGIYKVGKLEISAVCKVPTLI
jgi:hypothetical protein